MAVILIYAKICFPYIHFSSKIEFFWCLFILSFLIIDIDTLLSYKLLLLLLGFIPTLLPHLNFFLSFLSYSKELGYPRGDEKYFAAFCCITKFSLHFTERFFFPWLAIHHLLLKWKVICICGKGSPSFFTAALRASRDINFKRRDFLTEKHVAPVCA